VADSNVRLPVGDAVAEQVISLPMSPYLDAGQQHSIVAALASILSRLPPRRVRSA
jgi:UDP-2-acetamido-2-deoxy-ribo-hexuluronate aminotransferase